MAGAPVQALQLVGEDHADQTRTAGGGTATSNG
jgi:hypothetical protein